MEDNSNTPNQETKHDLSQLKSIVSRINKQQAKACARTQYLSKLNLFLSSTNSLVEFIQKLFELKSLKTFETVHLFIHEKGQTKSRHLEVLRNKHREYVHDISDFSSFFQSIKKSKNRSYGQSKISGFNLEILGTFLAHEFSLSNHNLILIISRNDFLPQSKSEIENFKLLTSILSSFIELKLEQSLIKSKIEKIKEGIYLSPFEFDNFQLKRKTQNLIDHGDIFHHERVSLLGELLNTLRHELSNPLFGLELTTQLLLLEEHDSEQIEFINEIQSSIKRSQSILENFTHLYKDTEEFEIVDIEKLINEVFTLTKSESRHLKKTVINNNSPEMFKTNPTWLAQVVFNMVINSAQACKNSQGSELNIDLSLHDTKIHIKISDNGPGIKELGKDIFKPFYTTKEKGTGLGLAICHSLVKKLRGTIEHISSDKGAAFLIKLPYENPNH